MSELAVPLGQAVPDTIKHTVTEEEAYEKEKVAGGYRDETEMHRLADAAEKT